MIPVRFYFPFTSFEYNKLIGRPYHKLFWVAEQLLTPSYRIVFQCHIISSDSSVKLFEKLTNQVAYFKVKDEYYDELGEILLRAMAEP